MLKQYIPIMLAIEPEDGRNETIVLVEQYRSLHDKDKQKCGAELADYLYNNADANFWDGLKQKMCKLDP